MNKAPKQNQTTGRFETKHGLSFNKWFSIWSAMMQRCHNPNNESYPRYGGRGIEVCEQWRNAKVFIAWCEDQNPDPGLTVERVDNDKNYSPDNCVFADRKAQANNRRSTGFRFRDDRGKFRKTTT